MKFNKYNKLWIIKIQKYMNCIMLRGNCKCYQLKMLKNPGKRSVCNLRYKYTTCRQNWPDIRV